MIPANVSADDWTQEAHDNQRTGYTAEDPLLPWSYAWSWNGPDGNGNTTGNFYTAPLRDAHVITGGNYLYAPAGASGLYALNIQTGQQVWHYTGGDVQATPAYDTSTGNVYTSTRDGRIVKLNGNTGSILGTYSTNDTILKPLLLTTDSVITTTVQGNVHKINLTTMTKEWTYDAGSEITTTASYSPSTGRIFFGTNDLNVHAVSSTGQQVWKSKPTVRSATEYCGLYNYDYRWPVVADIPGVVFIRMRNPHPFDDGGNTNTEIRNYLTNTPDKQTLFALDTNTGAKKFIPAIQPDGSDHRPPCNGATGQLFHAISAAPVIKTLNGKQYAYMPWRNSQSSYDARWDGFMGEMVLDSTSISGYQAGDLRFIQFKGQIDPNMIADEIHPVSMAGDTIFHHHTNNVDSHRITDRSVTKGSTMNTPITTVRNPELVRHWATSNGLPLNPNKQTHFNNGLTVYDRYYGDGFWIYQGNLNKEMILSPEIQQGVTESLGAEEGSVNRYTFVSNGKIITTGPRGDIFVLNHSGSVIQATPAPTSVNPTVTMTIKLGDANNDNFVDGRDYIIWLVNYGTQTSNGIQKGDFNTDGTVNGQDYILWLKNYGI